MKFLFLMDPMERLLTDKDTTFALMLAATSRGHDCFHALPLALSAEGARLGVRSQKARVHRDSSTGKDGWSLGEMQSKNAEDFDAIFVRNDPPFNDVYMYMTQLLDRVVDHVFVLNSPRGLRDANEKLYALHFSRWMPRTMVASNRQQIADFVAAVGGQAVIKPLDGMAGLGIFLLRSDDRNFNAIVEATIGEHGDTYCMVQEYLPAAREGDKRILVLDGEPLGAILRVPRTDEARANLHMGGSAERAIITDNEREMIADIAPKLRADGLYFVGLDVIGGKLTEVNVTSPTGIQQMSRMDGVDYSARVIEWCEQKVHALHNAY